MTTLVERNENEVQESIPAKHETVMVTVGDQEADIDRDIVPLIKEMWIAEISTTRSCQELHPGWAWIEFEHCCCAERFLSSVAGDFNSDPDSLYNRMRSNGPISEGAWQYDVRAEETSLIIEADPDTAGVKELPGKTPEISFFASVLFPTTDIEVLEKRMREFNRPRH